MKDISTLGKQEIPSPTDKKKENKKLNLHSSLVENFFHILGHVLC
jgi:hypothetical protein